MTFFAQETSVQIPPMPAWQLWVVAGFGLLVLLIFAFIRIRTANARMGYSVAFSRTMGLITIAILGVVLAVATAPSDVKTAAFTLLGTIAGFFISDRGSSEKGRGSTQTATTDSAPEDGARADDDAA